MCFFVSLTRGNFYKDLWVLFQFSFKIQFYEIADGISVFQIVVISKELQIIPGKYVEN